MPTYDYRCARCHEQFELWQSFSDDTLTTCPVQGGPAACEAPGEGTVRKVFSKVGIAFKGDGFYKNDHRVNAGSGSDRSESTTSSGSEGSKSDDKKSDSKSSDSSKSEGSGTKSDGSGSAKKSSDSKSAAGPSS
jgi:predicted nucleic acid-binding Zn ribbon protein